MQQVIFHLMHTVLQHVQAKHKHIQVLKASILMTSVPTCFTAGETTVHQRKTIENVWVHSSVDTNDKLFL